MRSAAASALSSASSTPGRRVCHGTHSGKHETMQKAVYGPQRNIASGWIEVFSQKLDLYLISAFADIPHNTRAELRKTKKSAYGKTGALPPFYKGLMQKL
jgi:hypothetical protein